MSARTALISHAPRQEQPSAELPQAQDVLRPELLAGSSGTPRARRFHQSFFDTAHDAIEAGCLLVLPDVVIGHAGPLSVRFNSGPPRASRVI